MMETKLTDREINEYLTNLGRQAQTAKTALQSLGTDQKIRPLGGRLRLLYRRRTGFFPPMKRIMRAPEKTEWRRDFWTA